MTWTTAGWVALGAALGGMLRFVLASRWDRDLPWGTLAANTGGSTVVGAAAGLGLGEAGWALLAVGFCGALTTFSSVTVQAWDQGWRRGTLLVLLTWTLAVGGCALGWWLGSLG